MTDQLETDLRAMLAARAAEISPDLAAGEAAIATRLRFGDTALAEIVPLPPARRTRWRMGVAAAVAAGAILAVAVWATRDTDREAVAIDPAPEAPPAIYTGAGSPEEVAGTYLFDRLDIAQGQELTVTRAPAEPEDPADLTGVTWQLTSGDALAAGTVVLRDLGAEWEVVESYSDGASIDEITRSATTIAVHSTGPAGSHLSLSVHRLDGLTITAGGCGGGVATAAGGTAPDTPPTECDLDDEPLNVGDEPVTVRLSVVTAEGVPLTLEERLVLAPDDDTTSGTSTTTSTAGTGEVAYDPTVGQPSDSPKDTAERFARDLFGVEYITIGADDSADGVTTNVTLEGEGTEATAVVVFDGALGRHRVIRWSDSLSKLQPNPDDPTLVVTPAAGALTITVYGSLSDTGGLDPASAQVPVIETSIDGPGTQHGPFELPEHQWIRLELATADGKVLRYLSSTGD